MSGREVRSDASHGGGVVAAGLMCRAKYVHVCPAPGWGVQSVVQAPRPGDGLQCVLQRVQGFSALLLVLNLAAPSGRSISCICYSRERERGERPVLGWMFEMRGM